MREGVGGGVSGATYLGASYTTPALSQAEKDDMNAALIEHFDPVRMTLPEIEAMQAMLSEAAARHRAEMDGPPEGDVETAFFQLGAESETAKATGLQGRGRAGGHRRGGGRTGGVRPGGG